MIIKDWGVVMIIKDDYKRLIIIKDWGSSDDYKRLGK